jgi:hypothetical protein
VKRLAIEEVQESLPSISWIYIGLNVKLETAARNGGEWSTWLLVCCAFCKISIIKEPSLLGCEAALLGKEFQTFVRTGLIAQREDHTVQFQNS